MTNAAGKSYERGQVIRIIESVISKMDGAPSPLPEIYAQLTQLANSIDRLKQDIAESHPGPLSEQDIPGATDELDEVVRSTAEATHAIMSACEAIESIAGELNHEGLTDQVTRIYEACGFQDITGQRITKVIGTLRKIEATISGLVQILDAQVGPIACAVAAQTPESEEDLLNGPQMPSHAVTQDDIDKLLAEFDET